MSDAPVRPAHSPESQVSDARLEEIERDHICAGYTFMDCYDSRVSGCSVLALVAEVRRLKRALALAQASRGVPYDDAGIRYRALVGRD